MSEKNSLSKQSISSVDIIMPSYNSEQFISQTINSVIAQTYKNWRLIIVDDNSNSETKKILKNYTNHESIKIIFLKKNKNTGFCRNLAIRNSKSDYIAFLDSDDIWDQEKLSKQLSFMKKNKYFFTYTNFQPFGSNNKHKNLREVRPTKYFTFEKFIKNTSIATSSMIIEKSLIGNIKFSKTKICEDYFFKCQVLQKANYAYCLSENLMQYRIRKDSLQSNILRNLYWIWYINRNYNRLGFFKNLLSVFCISVNSIKKYGFK